MAATAAVYNRLHTSSLLAGSGGGGGVIGGIGHHHTQLARSLERILEEAQGSGELILTNRKLKDFPKTGTKYSLADTVIADLSRNRFCELPEEITAFAFLETLLLYHNTIRSIPESVKHLTSLTYLDLRSNQLSSLPREICFLPLQVLLVSNNRLSSLPDELGRMDRLTDLDASYNQLTALPARIGELHSLRSFSLRSNQLMYLPRELTCLTLVSLDVSNNRIASLPLEIRQMSTLVEFNLENNPLTIPPASLCIRGLVHVFKYLDTQATKDEKGSRAGGNYDGYTTLRRAPRHNSSGNVLETSRIPTRHLLESAHSNCDGLDKRWSHDTMPMVKSKMGSPRKISAAALSSCLSSETMDASLTSSSSTIVDESLTVSAPAAIVKPLNVSEPLQQESSPSKRCDELPVTLHQLINYAQSSSSNGSSPDQEDITMDDPQQQQQPQHQTTSPPGKFDEKYNKNLGNIQTYREYKEALKQKHNQEISNVYKMKGGQKTLYDMSEASQALNSINQNGVVVAATIDDVDVRFNGSAAVIPSLTAPMPKSIMKNGSGSGSGCGNGSGVVVNGGVATDDVIIPKKPIQKVIPSRNTELSGASTGTGTATVTSTALTNGECLGYVKPNSPMKMANGGGILTNSNKFGGIVGGASKLVAAKAHRTVTWNHDIPAEKLSFTMRREFDRQREETELMTQLRSIIETRLKMTLPEDIASALTDGVILCHLANYVRPRSVASIHVPSPGVSKLTMARCRRNVDNFLEACRKIGVDEELICSCGDVVPARADDEMRNDGGDCDVNGICNGRSSNQPQEQQRQQQQQQQQQSYERERDNKTPEDSLRQTLPNPSAVLKTVAALIAMDANPHHQNIKNMQQQQLFQHKLHKHQQQFEHRDLEQQQQPQYMNIDYQQRGHCFKTGEQQQQQQEQQQEQQTATCTKEQTTRIHKNTIKTTTSTTSKTTKNTFYYKNAKSLYENVYTAAAHASTNGGCDEYRDDDDVDGLGITCNGNVVDNSSFADHNDSFYLLQQQQQQQQDQQPQNMSPVSRILRQAKIKTFQKMRMNLNSSGGKIDSKTNQNNNNNNNNHCPSGSSTLQTIVETEGDVIGSGAYHLIDEKPEKTEEELSLKIISTTYTGLQDSVGQKYKLLELRKWVDGEEQLLHENNKRNAVSKRIEFFEQSNLGLPISTSPPGAAMAALPLTNSKSPKSKSGAATNSSNNIFSIYTVATAAVQLTDDQKLLNDCTKEKKAGPSLCPTHDSNALTIILSCVFILTFMLLLFFPLPG